MRPFLFAVSLLLCLVTANAVEYEAIFSEGAKWDHVRYEYAQRGVVERDSTVITLDRTNVTVGRVCYDIVEIGSWRVYMNGRTLMFHCIKDGYVSAHVKLCEYDNGIRLIIVREGKNGRMYWCVQK